MELMMGALPSVITKLGDLLVISEYNLNRKLKGEIRYLQDELKSMKGALEKVSNTPADQLDSQDKIWAGEVRELSYDIEDSIDKFMVHGNRGKEKLNFIDKFINQCSGLVRKFKFRHGIATEIRDFKSLAIEVAERRGRYGIINSNVTKTVTIDPRLIFQYENATELVGVDKAREEVVKILIQGNEVSEQKNKIVSIIGFGGLGKTTLANSVYEHLRTQFECSAFITVSQTPDITKLHKELLYQLAKRSTESSSVVRELREFLQRKRYFIVIDDVWDISVLKMIKCALPDNNSGSKIIATSRVLNVAEQDSSVYMLKPLSLNNSRKLLYRRIFGSEDTEKCPDEELAEVCDKILKKCAGVPLAIITISSLLASKGRNIMEWYKVYKSIGTGLENSLAVQYMRNILLLSYYDLPPHLKSCLLYFSVFPEDSKIGKDRLIWMWIAEDFVQCERQGESVSELGESYFNELVNRSMIQFVNKPYREYSEYCFVHDMVLHLMRELSKEENFVTVLGGYIDGPSSSRTVRRLSIQNCKVDQVAVGANASKEKIRSVVVFLSSIDPKLELRSFRILRILDLDRCALSDVHSLKHIGELIHLRYLGLGETSIPQVPDEIVNLQLLQTLDIRGTKTSFDKFPSAVFKRKNLRCLQISSDGGVPNGISNLTSLEVLTLKFIYHSTTIMELGYLRELRSLKIILHPSCTDGLEKSLAESLVECLNTLEKIQLLDIRARGMFVRFLDGWRAPSHLRRVELLSCWFSTRPNWMNPSYLLNLSVLCICVEKLQQEDFKILGKFQVLRSLTLYVGNEELGIFPAGPGLVVDASWFPCLSQCKLQNFIPPVVFRQGAMPRLTELEFTFTVRKTREIVGSIGGFELGLGNLRSLQNIDVCFVKYSGEGIVGIGEAEDVVMRAVETHPNRPTIRTGIHYSSR